MIEQILCAQFKFKIQLRCSIDWPVLIFWALINKNQYYKKLTEKNVKKISSDILINCLAGKIQPFVHVTIGFLQ